MKARKITAKKNGTDAFCVLSASQVARTERNSLRSTVPPLVLIYGTASASMIRLAYALLQGPIWREQADRIAKVSNSPDVIRNIRQLGLGKTHLVCTRYSIVKSDGTESRPGRYWLTPTGRAMLTKWLSASVKAG